MLRRNRGAGPVQEAIDTPRGPAAAVGGNVDRRFKMKQRLFSFGDDFWIENERGQRAYKVDGKMLRLKDTLRFEDAHGRELYHIQAKMVDIRETMDILTPDGRKAAIVRNALLTPFRDKWTINVPGRDDLIAQGNILQHEYVIREEGRRGDKLAEVSAKWFRLRDTYGVEVDGSADAALMLAITVVIDMMEHNGALKSNAGGGIDLL